MSKNTLQAKQDADFERIYASDGLGETVDGAVEPPLVEPQAEFQQANAPKEPDTDTAINPLNTPPGVPAQSEPRPYLEPVSKENTEAWVQKGVELSAATPLQYEFKHGGFRLFNDANHNVNVPVDDHFIETGEQLSEELKRNFLFKGGVLYVYDQAGSLLVIGAGYDQILSTIQ